MRTRVLGSVAAAAVMLMMAPGCIFVNARFGGKMKEVVVEESPRFFELNRVALIDIDGFISSGGGRWRLLSGTTVADVKEKLNRAAADSRVVAVVLRINSPGGEASASDMIYEEILKFKRQSGKPVVAALMGVAASGGYYTACAADRIVAAPTCITGSIGVLLQFYNVEGLYGKIGLRREVIKSGAKKDIGSSTRAPTPEERRILTHLTDTLFDQFVAAVKKGRPAMTKKDFASVSDGRPVTAREAHELHMVDAVGHLDDAIAEALALADVGGADVIMYQPDPSYNANIYAGTGEGAGMLVEGLEIFLRRRGPTFLYLWLPEP